MKRLLALFLLILVSAVSLNAQEKGVDQQNSRIKDGGTNRVPAINGGKTDTGAGRGIDFGKGRTVVPPPVANPYRLSVPNDVLLKAVEELMRDRKLILDDTVSRPDTGILISQPYTFAKGAVVTTSDLNRLAEVPQSSSQGWTRARYTMVVEVQPIDGISTSVSVNARIEGKSDSIVGAEWVSLKSTGAAEQEFLIALVVKVTGAPPPGYEPEP
ncbi:MAG: hypothetical protein WCD76_00165 [Pyrinomonadaceae bacterium]